MVPLDKETVALVDRIAQHRSPGQPLPHPRTGGRVEFLLTHHGRRFSVDGLSDELTRAAALRPGSITSRRTQLQHTTPQRW